MGALAVPERLGAIACCEKLPLRTTVSPAFTVAFAFAIVRQGAAADKPELRSLPVAAT
jgi:hypothetical protein